MLLAGSYTAQLRSKGADLGRPVSFTVAEYTLAPLSARLASHRLDRAAGALHFELAVESYQVPYDREMIAALVEDGRETASTRISPVAPGLYAGRLPIGGGVDANGFDPDTHLAFASCGEGVLTVVSEDSPDKFTVAQSVATERGARTMAFDPKTHEIFLVTAKFGPPPAPTPGQERPRPPILPDTFEVLVVGK